MELCESSCKAFESVGCTVEEARLDLPAGADVGDLAYAAAPG